jgi:uncharacterized membrane protein YccC
MADTLKSIIKRELKLLFQLKKTERLWHVPVLASLCVGLPLLAGYLLGHLEYGIVSCLGGLVILYLPPTNFRHRRSTMLFSSLGFILSYSLGLMFSFNPILSSLMMAVFAFFVNWVTNIFKLGPPGNFFFIMIAAMASCQPFNLEAIPVKAGLLALGVLFACALALLYSLYMTAKYKDKLQAVIPRKKNTIIISESITIGAFTGISLFVPHLLNFHNPYWVPISSLAIMQGVSTTHVWQRSFHRMLGTVVGLGLTWLLLQFDMQPLSVCISILMLQFIIEMLIVRHYALACIFITPLTIFLADIGSLFTVDSDLLISARFTDIAVGSLIGGIGGWLLHHQQLKAKADRHMRIAKVLVRRIR